MFRIDYFEPLITLTLVFTLKYFYFTRGFEFIKIIIHTTAYNKERGARNVYIYFDSTFINNL